MTGTLVSRRVAAVPYRTAGEAWRVVAGLVAEPGTAAHDELLRAAGPAGMLIAEETTSADPIVVTSSSGPRYRIYTLHGDAAVDGAASEQALPTLPADGDGWAVALPCGPDDVDDVVGALASAPHVTTYVPDTAGAAGLSAPGAVAGGAMRNGRLSVDRSRLGAQ